MAKKKRRIGNYFSSEKYLGDVSVFPDRFENLSPILKEFKNKEFKKLNDRQKNERINRTLLELIQKQKQPAFLLIAVLDYIDRVNEEKIYNHYSFSSFELWLNQFSNLSSRENYYIRSLIVGKWIPREEYQILFPIGMGKIYPGTHFITAHSSPDLDTTIASFWGWMDAFGARVSEGLHIWNVPGGAPPSNIEITLLFYQIFGPNVFQYLAKTRTTLAISSLDLITQQGLIRQQLNQSTLQADHERAQKAIILVDDYGYYLGDWRHFDVEGVRQVTMLLNHCLRWFESNLHLNLVSFFAKENPSLKDIPAFIRSIFGKKIKDSGPVQEFTEKQKNHLEVYLRKVLSIPDGMESTFEEFAEAVANLGLFDLKECLDLVDSIYKASLFDHAGFLIENRPKIFHFIEKIITAIDKAIQSVRGFTEKLEVALSIKVHVFGYMPQVISYRADIDEIRSKMANYPYLTVTVPDKKGKQIPLGIVKSSDLHKPILGTVTIRDFCNREETKIPSYLEIISVIDHHKININTMAAPVVHISDSQSSNSIVADLAFQINDRYGTLGMNLQEIDHQINSIKKAISSSDSKRILARLLQKHLAAEAREEEDHPFFIHPLREFIEYLHFLYGILDDTDLLTKVSQRDIECVASLLNRLKSLMLGKEVEIIHFDDLKKDQNFLENAAKRILQNPDMHSLYSKIYVVKEKLLEKNILACSKGQTSNIFVDTKEQNGCCRVGQTKMFSNNFPTFEKHVHKLRLHWYELARHIYEEQKEFDLHLQMISTIPSADDLFSGKKKNYTHKDELWIWIPSTEQAIEHLKSFLNSFRSSPQVVKNELEVEFLGKNAEELEQIFKESFLPVPRKVVQNNLPVAVLKFNAGSINSRKAMIAPYLPKLVI
ncbi:MAG: hypothetical protein L0207_03715 [Chlamydiae bacterium]|nr:hypothetical protein [Chlamydiota bacterium]